jgi:hypothetical protein
VITRGGAESLATAATSKGRFDGRPRCAACGEPIVLDDPKDPESWIHAPDANDRADHTAWIDIERTSAEDGQLRSRQQKDRRRA